MKQPSPNVPALKHLHGREEKKFNSKVEQIYRTKGLTSADRSNKATLLLTVPRSHSSRLQRIHPRSYLKIVIRKRTHQAFPLSRPSLPDVVHEQKLYLNSINMCGTYIVVSSTDSDLEAFSHNPADDSFAPLPARTGANTKYLNERFLSY